MALVRERFDAVSLQTVQVLLFSREASTPMAAWVFIVAGERDEGDAVLGSAALSESRVGAVVLHFDFSVAEAALTRILVALRLLASHADVVGRASALGAEVYGALAAANSEFSHVVCCTLRNHFSSLVLLLVVRLGWLQNDDRRTVDALHQGGVHLNSHLHHFSFNLLKFLR